MVAAEQGGPVEEGVGESSSPPREDAAAPAPAGSDGSGGGARDICAQMFSVGPKFKGMKMVPPGPHFVYYCSPNRHGNEFAPTVGFFLTTHPSEDFFTVVFEAPVVDGDLLSWARKLKSLLETTFGWDLEDNAVNLFDEDDEFAPVVVEMDGS